MTNLPYELLKLANEMHFNSDWPPWADRYTYILRLAAERIDELEAQKPIEEAIEAEERCVE